MTLGIQITVGNQSYRLEEFLKVHPLETDSAHVKACTEVIQRWLSAQQQFQFQTSGSTGPPKTITWQRGDLEASARLTQNAFGLKSGDTALVCLDPEFIAGTMMIVRCLVIGMNMAITEPSHPLEGQLGQIDFAAFVPAQIIKLLEEKNGQLDQISTAIIGGAPLSDSVVNTLEGSRTSYFATYGMTETITHVALQKLNGDDAQESFHCLQGVTVSCDSRGCLVIRAAHIGGGEIVTNDLARVIGQDQFRLVGRFDRIINSGGVKIQAEKVEEAVAGVLKTAGLKCRFFVAGAPDPRLGEKVILVLESPEFHVEEPELLKSLSKVLGRFEAPKSIISVDHFLETATQKIDRIGTVQTIFKGHS